DAIVFEAEAMEDFAGARFEFVAAEVRVLLLHVSETIEHLIVIGTRNVRHRLLEIDQLVMQIAEAAAARDRFVEDAAAGRLLDVLAEVADRDFLRNGDFAFIGRFLADDEPEERRFAGAVRTDESRLFARVQLKGGVDEDELAPVLLGYFAERDHERARERAWR